MKLKKYLFSLICLFVTATVASAQVLSSAIPNSPGVLSIALMGARQYNAGNNSMIGGALTVVPLYAFNKPFGIEPIFAALVVSTVLMVIVSLITYKKGLTPRKLAETG